MLDGSQLPQESFSRVTMFFVEPFNRVIRRSRRSFVFFFAILGIAATILATFIRPLTEDDAMLSADHPFMQIQKLLAKSSPRRLTKKRHSESTSSGAPMDFVDEHVQAAARFIKIFIIFLAPGLKRRDKQARLMKPNQNKGVHKILGPFPDTCQGRILSHLSHLERDCCQDSDLLRVIRFTRKRRRFHTSIRCCELLREAQPLLLPLTHSLTQPEIGLGYLDELVIVQDWGALIDEFHPWCNSIFLPEIHKRTEIKDAGYNACLTSVKNFRLWMQRQDRGAVARRFEWFGTWDSKRDDIHLKEETM